MQVEAPRTLRMVALTMLCLAIPIAVVSVGAGGIGLLWTTSTNESLGIFGVILVFGAPALCAFLAAEAFNRRAYVWAVALCVPALCLLLFFIASARF